VGGSRFAYSVVFQRKNLGIKKPETVFEEYREITERLKAPVFFVGDLKVRGKTYIEKLTQLLGGEKRDVEVFFEFFAPPPREVLGLLRKAGGVRFSYFSTHLFSATASSRKSKTSPLALSIAICTASVKFPLP
jgi:hypothetical protein